MRKDFHPSWLQLLSEEFDKDYFHRLEKFVDERRSVGMVFPHEDNVFRAFQLTPRDRVRVVILGQDPYHDQGQAHGLAFSVEGGVRHPPSLRNIFQELKSDVGVEPPESGDLSHWAEQGVLLLNTVLTVDAHQPLSHRKQGWETFTDRVVAELGRSGPPAVFVFWGNAAREKEKRVTYPGHEVISSPHPSPFSARRGFFGSRPFSRINRALDGFGYEQIRWSR